MGLMIHGALAAALLVAATTPAETPSRTSIRSLLPKAKGQRLPPVRAVAGPARTPGVVGTIQYDNDVPFSRDGGAPFVGNRFNVGVQDPHSVASVSFRRGGAAGPSVTVLVFPVPILNVIGYGGATGLPPTTAGSMVFSLPLQLPVVAHTGSFIAGLVNLYTGACLGNTMLGAPCDGPALTAGTMDPGMGFHAVRVFGILTSGVDIPNRNAIIRVTGDNLPVELMGFGVE